jgi:hypothetical protein
MPETTMEQFKEIDQDLMNDEVYDDMLDDYFKQICPFGELRTSLELSVF